MQWFLTLFATCLPEATALRVWDSVLLEGSEILLRTALAIWGKLSECVLFPHFEHSICFWIGQQSNSKQKTNSNANNVIDVIERAVLQYQFP